MASPSQPRGPSVSISEMPIRVAVSRPQEIVCKFCIDEIVDLGERGESKADARAAAKLAIHKYIASGEWRRDRFVYEPGRGPDKLDWKLCG